ncbi:hypothetical protein BDM02DRAFT_2029073 [Thelephora ganbajun]|uniref:Uncharacterized protein n=1 Tax=Thelephora ganbajun TaxID=370292 RepID=A0ACB6YZE1_THEGA|nr:hypothetical protein BDM02DRAFT_2029073 [Thelephora ganbajun]
MRITSLDTTKTVRGPGELAAKWDLSTSSVDRYQCRMGDTYLRTPGQTGDSKGYQETRRRGHDGVDTVQIDTFRCITWTTTNPGRDPADKPEQIWPYYASILAMCVVLWHSSMGDCP